MGAVIFHIEWYNTGLYKAQTNYFIQLSCVYVENEIKKTIHTSLSV